MSIFNDSNRVIFSFSIAGVDSSKLDLSDEFDTLIDPLDLVLDTDDFVSADDDLMWKMFND